MIFPALVKQLIALAQPFADVYADNKVLSIGTTMLHIGGLLAGGGLAIATDRAVLRATPLHGAAQRAVLEDLASTHKLVVSAIGVSVVSGLLFLAADVKTFLTSPVYWVKMAGVLLLLVNGLRLWRAEGRLRKSMSMSASPEALPAAEWQALRGGAITSLVLWFAVMALGVVLEGS
ncbi:MAG: hypothetical protein ABI120_17015 [Gemmatimonadaceae bacterium]